MSFFSNQPKNQLKKLPELFPEVRDFEFRLDDKHDGSLYCVQADMHVCFCSIMPGFKVAAGFNYPLEISFAPAYGPDDAEIVLETEYSHGHRGADNYHLEVIALYNRYPDGRVEPLKSFVLNDDSLILNQLGIYEPEVKEVKTEEKKEPPKPIDIEDIPTFDDFKL